MGYRLREFKMPNLSETGLIDNHNKGLFAEIDEQLKGLHRIRTRKNFLETIKQNLDTCVEIVAVEGENSGTS